MNLKVLTFNIHNGINHYEKYNLRQIAEFIGLIKPDLAGLQEVSRFWSQKTNYQDMVGFLAERLEMHPAFSATIKRNYKRSFGNLILSKYPFINIWDEILPGNLEPRNYLAVQVQAGGARVNFLTTHLGLSDSERLVQVSRIVNFGVQLGDPLIITGDFNQGSDDPGMALIKRNWIKHEPSPPQGTLRLRNGQLGPEIDMIFSSPNLVLKRLKVYENELSDHLPVCGEFEMELAWNQVAGQPIYNK
ncbi:MAG: endonuclease/exonuclease/phosphatase family protein [Bacteroidota bacterium]